LLEDLRSLLREEQEDTGKLRAGAVAAARGAELVDSIERRAGLAHPERIGPYEIVDVLGEGGMGVVYHGRQSEPIERDVAIKLIRAGLNSESVAARFEWERRSLARMSHPHIAKVFDAGASADGRPYVAMELVLGEPIAKFCDARALALRDRVRLFLRVCGAVHHAHERGVMHRDLKPSNILVRERDGIPDPVVIDFGIAKALHADPSTDAPVTLEEQRIGTPAYMSPEQLRGDHDEIDTRTDVYALGVILYELLTGRHPFEGEEGSLDELSRSRTTSAARPPSSHAAELDADAARRLGAPKSSLRRDLRGDLDTICLKCIRGEADRRYVSVAHLADDLKRYLEDRPILARSDSWWYRVSKMRKRHPVTAALSFAGVGFALMGVLFIAFHADRLATERDRANRNAEQADQIAGFLEGLFTEVDPTLGGAADLTAEELLNQGADRLRTELSDQPVVRGRLLGVVGRVYHSIGLFEPAESLIREGLASLGSSEGEHPVELAQLQLALGTVLHDQRRLEESEEVYRDAVANFRRAGGETEVEAELALALSYLATTIQSQGRLQEALPLLRESIAIGTRVHGEDHADVAWARGMLGQIQLRDGRYAEALVTLRGVLDSQRRIFDHDSIDTAHTLNNIGGIETYLEDFDGADRTLSEALEMYRRIYDRDHPAVARAMFNLGKVRIEQSRLEDADRLIRGAHEMNIALVGEAHYYSTISLSNIARVEAAKGNRELAERLHLRVMVLRDSLLGVDHPRSVAARQAYGEFLIEAGEAERAVAPLEEALNFEQARLRPGHPDLAMLRLLCAEAALSAGDRVRARELVAAARPVLLPLLDESHRERLRLDALAAELEDGS